MKSTLIKLINKSFKLLELPIFNLMRFTLHFPTLSTFIVKRLRSHVKIHQKLRTIAYRHDLFKAPNDSTSASFSNAYIPKFSHLTPHARQIYTELKRAIKIQHENNN